MFARLLCWLGLHDLFANVQHTNPWATNSRKVLSCSRCAYFKLFEPIGCGWSLPVEPKEDFVVHASREG